ncbi:hypothetical protein EB796_018711 [Bugula neritina]|uniref:Uncharacterized protein n=1 Tax=Bugula neritina TaxID=10212 RepID=A0A7J7J9S7_BUGNE|nr:hypothetical protein EB796_018711 [Bugula neritina]
MVGTQALLLTAYALSLAALGAASTLKEDDYDIDILYQQVPNEDPILYFTVRTCKFVTCCSSSCTISHFIKICNSPRVAG